MHQATGFAAVVVLLANSVVTGAPAIAGADGLHQRNGSTLAAHPDTNTDFKESPNPTATTVEKGTATDDIAPGFRSGGIGWAYPTGIATLIPYDKSIYLCPVQIGTPPQTLNLILDTGSADLWVYSVMTNPGLTPNHPIYHPESSNTSKLQAAYSWETKYGSGSRSSYAGGNVIEDVVSIGGAAFKYQAVQSLLSYQGPLTNMPYISGVLGLGQGYANSIRPGPQRTFTENIYGWDWMYSAQFAIDLRVGSTLGTIEFGLTDSTKYRGKIEYANVIDNRNGYWAFYASGYRVDGHAIYTFLPVMVDTGVTFIVLPEEIAKNYYANVVGAVNYPAFGGYIFPCTSRLPDFGIVITQEFYSIHGWFLNYQKLQNGFCLGGIQTSPLPDGYAILGSLWVSMQYVVFHIGQKQVGVATKRIT